MNVIYLGFAKDFDKVDRDMTCHKLCDLGMVGELGEWLQDFLKDRHRAVTANGANSKETQIANGVPQSTDLGPSLFILDLSDILSDAQIATLASCANDTKVSQTIQNPGSIANLQRELDALYRWAENNSIKMNAGKFQILHHKHAKLKGMQTGCTGPGEIAIPNQYQCVTWAMT